MSAVANDPMTAAAGSMGRRVVQRIDSGQVLPGEEPLQVAVEVCWPDPARFPRPSTALVCLPGGGMSRRFYDLVPADGSHEFNFAEQLGARGFIVILIDHLGVGDSSRPADVFGLTPELLVSANRSATDAVVAALRDGSLTPVLPALPRLKTLGVGHSMGALLTVLQQSMSPTHAGIAVLGFSTAGLPQYVSEEALARMAADPVAVRGEVPRLARTLFGNSPSTRRSESMQTGDIYAGAAADPRGVLAIKAAMSQLLPVPAYLAMLPGNVATECAAIDVPVFIGVGERDMTGPAHAIPAAFSASHDVTLHVLPKAGHSHFLFPARHLLFDRLADWAARVTR